MASSDAEVVSRVRGQVAAALERQRVLRSRRSIVVGVSGGADSLCLLDTLVAVVPRAEKRIFVGHVDHQLRPGSAADAKHVRTIAEGYGVPWAVATVNVPALAESERLGVEAAARLARYRELRQMADLLHTDVAATGHTRDDSVETVLMHLLRGSGTHGLAGIAELEHLSAWSLGQEPRSRAADLRLIRPLLGVSRTDTVQYCETRRIAWLTDETNSDPRYHRNRVRAHLLPVLRTYNPAVDRSISRMAHAVRDEDAWLDRLVTARWRRIARPVDRGSGVDLAGWRRQPVPIQRRLVRMIAEAHRIDDLGFEAVERALAVATEDGPPRAELGRGLCVERRTDTLVFDIATRVRDG